MIREMSSASSACQRAVSQRVSQAVAAPLTGGMQILKVGKMVSLVGADEETFQRALASICLSMPHASAPQILGWTLSDIG